MKLTSTWRRNADEALPARGKIVGGYVNMAFQKSEAEMNGYDEAVVLTADGHVNEASAANLFIVRDGVALTPPVNDDLLEGVFGGDDADSGTELVDYDGDLAAAFLELMQELDG